MALWVRSCRYADRMVRVGRLLVVFRGEYAELPEWAARGRDWMLLRLPGVSAAEAPREVFGVYPEPRTAPGVPVDVGPDEPPPAPVASEEPSGAALETADTPIDPGESRRARGRRSR